MVMSSRCSEVALVVLAACFFLCLVGPRSVDGKGSEGPKPQSGYRKIHFYLQEVLNSSFFPVVQPVPGHGLFGLILVADQNATATPDFKSTPIARIKGTGVAVNNDASSASGAYIVSTAVFTEASGFGGSTLSFQGYNNLALKTRQISITGGTGKFVLARGWLDISTYFSDGLARIIQEITAHVYYGK
eukprot:TRINITY_DN6699_c0_g1_i1.p1 TRINITY_DN6699_c0_g1~~TRINITY_DN6699_c0_g1_i1.p1  ORF type:complete len:188 (+),score=9.22 TRINITY_DN6699_c0_g1_i1:151-714(+)